MTCKKPVLAHFSDFIPMQEEFSSSSTSSTSSSFYDSPCLNHEFIQGVVANHRFAEDVPSLHEDNVLKEKGGFQINTNSLLSLPSETTRVAPPCSSPASPLTLLTGEERGIHGRSELQDIPLPGAHSSLSMNSSSFTVGEYTYGLHTSRGAALEGPGEALTSRSSSMGWGSAWEGMCETSPLRQAH